MGLKNPRISPKERNLIKGALRRTFSRSELRRRVLDASLIEHSDPARPRVTKWCRCAQCGQPVARYQAAVDHISPLVPVDIAWEDMSLDVAVDRLWCEENNLQILDPQCHTIKTKAENATRRQYRQPKRKGRKNERKKL